MILGVTELRGRTGHAAGRELLSALYRRETGRDLPEILTSPRGKPYFPQGDWHFSISHTPRRAFAVLAREPVGLDAEELDRTLSPRLPEKILSPGELRRYEAAPEKQRALLSLWVLKEAQAKFTGEGLRGFPNHTDFSPADPRLLEIQGCIAALITASGRTISQEDIYVI